MTNDIKADTHKQLRMELADLVEAAAHSIKWKHEREHRNPPTLAVCLSALRGNAADAAACRAYQEAYLSGPYNQTHIYEPRQTVVCAELWDLTLLAGADRVGSLWHPLAHYVGHHPFGEQTVISTLIEGMAERYQRAAAQSLEETIARGRAIQEASAAARLNNRTEL